MNDNAAANNICYLADKIDKLYRGMIAEMNAYCFPGGREQVAEQLDALIDSPHNQPTTTRHTQHTPPRSE